MMKSVTNKAHVKPAIITKPSVPTHPRYVKEQAQLKLTDIEAYQATKSKFSITVNTNGNVENRCTEKELQEAILDWYDQSVPQCFIYKNMTKDQGNNSLRNLAFTYHTEFGPETEYLHGHVNVTVTHSKSQIQLNIPSIRKFFHERLGFPCYIHVKYRPISENELAERYLTK
jgi:hypothetical protein